MKTLKLLLPLIQSNLSQYSTFKWQKMFYREEWQAKDDRIKLPWKAAHFGPSHCSDYQFKRSLSAINELINSNSNKIRKRSSLRLSATITNGICRIYRRNVNRLSKDCNKLLGAIDRAPYTSNSAAGQDRLDSSDGFEEAEDLIQSAEETPNMIQDPPIPEKPSNSNTVCRSSNRNRWATMNSDLSDGFEEVRHLSLSPVQSQFEAMDGLMDINAEETPVMDPPIPEKPSNPEVTVLRRSTRQATMNSDSLSIPPQFKTSNGIMRFDTEQMPSNPNVNAHRNRKKIRQGPRRKRTVRAKTKDSLQLERPSRMQDSIVVDYNSIVPAVELPNEIEIVSNHNISSSSSSTVQSEPKHHNIFVLKDEYGMAGAKIYEDYETLFESIEITPDPAENSNQWDEVGLIRKLEHFWMYKRYLTHSDLFAGLYDASIRSRALQSLMNLRTLRYVYFIRDTHGEIVDITRGSNQYRRRTV